MGAAVIETAALSRRYGPALALDALTVQIEPGITGLIGANGAGKSTLIKLLLGLVAPTSGTARVLGHAIDGAGDADGVALRRLVGYMPEHDCLPPDLSAAEFVTWLGRCSGLPAAAARERAAEMLRHVGLFEERYRPMGGYSTGMAQRVKLAQALVHDPALLILDEPTNGLDPAGREEMLTLIARTGREFGMSVLVSSHLLGELERLCDGVVVLDHGRLVRAERLGVLTGTTGLVVVEIDGDVQAVVDTLTQRGIQALREPTQLVVTLPARTGDAQQDVRQEQATFDAVRDAIAAQPAALLRMTRRRGHLDDLFRSPG
jgi:ABC-2 type transport system ATP-binding protein